MDERICILYGLHNLQVGLRMPLPPFNDSGYLPDGDHPAPLCEVERRFCWNHRRREIFNGLRYVVDQLRVRQVSRIWLDGSFVTMRERPKDADVIYVAPAGADTNQWGMLAPARRRDLLQYHKVDLWKFPSPQRVPGNPFMSQTIKEFFRTDRNGAQKGFMEIVEWSEE